MCVYLIKRTIFSRYQTSTADIRLNVKTIQQQEAGLFRRVGKINPFSYLHGHTAVSVKRYLGNGKVNQRGDGQIYMGRKRSWHTLM